VTAAVSTQINRIKKPIKKYSETLHYHACNCICHWYKLIDDDYGELGCSRLILTKDKKHQRMIRIDYINVRYIVAVSFIGGGNWSTKRKPFFF
jgi:hypothetical protein